LNGKQQEWEAVVLIPFIDEVSCYGFVVCCSPVVVRRSEIEGSSSDMNQSLSNFVRSRPERLLFDMGATPTFSSQ